MTSLAVVPGVRDCWNSIGVRGDRSCPELIEFVHCQNCPVFAAAGRRFLDAPSPVGYLDEWTDRLAEHADELSCDLISVLVFRLADEWLALPIQTLVEVTPPRPVHRVPYRAGLLAGLVNIRGEPYLCAHLAKLLRVGRKAGAPGGADPSGNDDRRQGPALAPDRLLVVRRDADRWVFRV